jgi:hypothetical protein
MSTDIDYENPWFYNGKPFTSADIGEYFGFVYLITNKSTNENTLVENIFGSSEHLKGKKEK